MTYKEIKDTFEELILKERKKKISIIKFRLLFTLYRKHYTNQAGIPQVSATLIKKQVSSTFHRKSFVAMILID